MSADGRATAARGDREDGSEGEDRGDGRNAAELAAQVELLAAENRRLRAVYRDAMRTRYRQTAAGFGALGALALLAGWLFPGVRTVMFALGGTGVFAGVLTYFLTPERFVPARVGEAVYGALADNGGRIVGELELADERVYVPREDGVTLFVPQRERYEVPADEDLDATFVLPRRERERGLALTPTGRRLAELFEDTDDAPAEPAAVAARLASALVEQFELVERADAETDASHGRVSVGVAGPAYAPVDGFDNPIASFVAVGLARALGRPVTLSVVEPDDERYDALVVCSWTVEGGDGGDGSGRREGGDGSEGGGGDEGSDGSGAAVDGETARERGPTSAGESTRDDRAN
ncbi:hypothetical protein [Halomarina pelagica]|uniref:hypothetical protein n=1 Tax=Halomarina pelagica TaxID=2961599 RepID=UPI0020C3C153|nr:hypothetical protein [Halomarina sp. BND7]